jgi:hypothetical protein
VHVHNVSLPGPPRERLCRSSGHGDGGYASGDWEVYGRDDLSLSAAHVGRHPETPAGYAQGIILPWIAASEGVKAANCGELDLWNFRN